MRQPNQREATWTWTEEGEKMEGKGDDEGGERAKNGEVEGDAPGEASRSRTQRPLESGERGWRGMKMAEEEG